MGRYRYEARLRGLNIESAKADFVIIDPEFIRGSVSTTAEWEKIYNKK